MRKTPELAGEQVEIEVGEIPELVDARAKIDVVDKRIIKLLAMRGSLVGRIATIKQDNGLEPYQPARFAEMMENLRKYGTSVGVRPGLIDDVWEVIHEDSLASQRELASGEDNLS